MGTKMAVFFAGCQMSDVGCWLLEVGLMLDVRCMVLDILSQMSDNTYTLRTVVL